MLCFNIIIFWQETALGSKAECLGRTKQKIKNKACTHLPPIYIVKDKIKLLRGLEGVMESHKEGVLDIFQEHIAFCHDVVLLAKSTQGIRFSGKTPIQPAAQAHPCFERSWEPYGSPPAPGRKYSALSWIHLTLLHISMAQRTPRLTCELSTWILASIALPGLLTHWLPGEAAGDSRHTSFFFRMVFLCKTFTA